MATREGVFVTSLVGEELRYSPTICGNAAPLTVQSLPDGLSQTGAARIHAYLHRKEGDLWNSRYRHRRAGSVFPDHLSLQEEWDMLVRENLNQLNGPQG
ncbi:hypothetical protein [Thiorhodovibrio frisius]|uniref:Uncharacterized protein n=1 Tax=Thiorhodovibrio frisius TaxID=631362 RepID=H8Z2I6_9GAMM|nr:hypothetical protein [Thiorhodovibrio frisius]EIC21641.1 hypothetical protein Thi970DRAFT_01858 [Thiorhodovibrio frisius]